MCVCDIHFEKSRDVATPTCYIQSLYQGEGSRRFIAEERTHCKR